jgi:hypothetical protein
MKVTKVNKKRKARALFPLSAGVYYLRIEVRNMSNVSEPLFWDYLQVTIEP